MKKTLLVAALCVLAATAHARSISSGFSSARSFSTPSRSFSYSAPRPSYTPAYRPSYTPSRPVVVNKTVVVRQSPTVVHQAAPASSGGGFFSSFLGSMAGVGIANWLFGDHKKDEPQPAPQPQPVVPASAPVGAPK